MLAQVAPATFFNDFPSKEDVLVYDIRLWSIPVTLQCRAVAAQGRVLDAVVSCVRLHGTPDGARSAPDV